MNISTIEIKKITASAGYVLTNGETYSEEVWLGKNDNEKNWKEVPIEEYKAYLAEQEKMLAEQ